MKLRGTDIDFRYTRAADAERLTKATDRLRERSEEMEKAAEAGWGPNVKTTINVFREYIHTATGKDLLEGCDDLGVAEEAYYDFMDEVDRQKKEFQEQHIKRASKYVKLKEKVK